MGTTPAPSKFMAIVNEVAHAGALVVGFGLTVYAFWQHQATGASQNLTLMGIGGTLTVFSLHAYKWGPQVISALKGIKKDLPEIESLTGLLPGSVQGIAAIGEAGLSAVIDGVLAAQADAGGAAPSPTAVALAMAKAAAKPAPAPAAPGGA